MLSSYTKFGDTPLLRLFLKLTALLLLVGAPTIANAQGFINFTGPPTLQSGTASTQGAVYRYATVLPGIDALVTLAQFVGTTAALINVDDNTVFPERFQPVITCAGVAAANANTSCYVRFDFNFVRTGTSTPEFIYGLAVSAQDVDGNGQANSVREFTELIGASSVVTAAPTTLLATTSIATGTRFIQSDSANVQPGIGTADQYEVYAAYSTAAISGFSIIGGNAIGSAGCDQANTACQRQNSYSALPVDSNKPSLTVRKVSNGGTGTFTFTGNNGWVSQPVTTTAAGVATDSQSEALGTAGASTTITETAPFGYSLTAITCAGLAAGGTQTPTILGTGGGSVTLNAAATAVTVSAAGVANVVNIICTFTNRKLTATLTITKSNGVSTVTAGGITAYTITASNTGGDDATGALVRDPVAPGLSCTAISCAGAACPAPINVTLANLQGTGIALTNFTAGTSAVFTLTCGITATGL